MIFTAPTGPVEDGSPWPRSLERRSAPGWRCSSRPAPPPRFAAEINRSAKSLQDASSRRYEAVAERISQVLRRANESAGRAVSAVEHGAARQLRPRQPPDRDSPCAARGAAQVTAPGHGSVPAAGPAMIGTP